MSRPVKISLFAESSPSDVVHKFAELFCASYEIALTSQFDQDPNLAARMNITLDSPCP